MAYAPIFEVSAPTQPKPSRAARTAQRVRKQDEFLPVWRALLSDGGEETDASELLLRLDVRFANFRWTGGVYFVSFIQARIGAETVLSPESTEKGWDMWLSPFMTTSFGQ